MRKVERIFNNGSELNNVIDAQLVEAGVSKMDREDLKQDIHLEIWKRIRSLESSSESVLNIFLESITTPIIKLVIASYKSKQNVAKTIF